MNKKLMSYLVAGALGATFALTSPVLAGGGHGGHGGGMHFGGGHHGGGNFGHRGGFSRFAFHHRHRFGFYGGPFAYASYNGCWRRARTPYGLRWVNVCGGGYRY